MPDKGLAHTIGDNAAQAYREAFLEHDDALRVLQRLTAFDERKWTKRADRDRADQRASRSHLVDDFLYGTVQRAERDDDRLASSVR
jgi:hypothetical protein